MMTLLRLLLLFVFAFASPLRAQEGMLTGEPEEEAAEMTDDPEAPADAAGALPSVPFELQVKGNEHLTIDDIKEAIQEPLEMVREGGLSPALADDIAFYLGVQYRKLGYSQVEVDYAITGPNRLLLTIREGPLTLVRAVSFTGNHAFPDERLRDQLTGVVQNPRRKVDVPFVEGNIDSGAGRIRGLYRSEGFLDVVVDAPEITLSPDKTRADISVDIEEGTQYRFGELVVDGDLLFFPRERLLDELEVFTSRPYTPLTVTNIQRKIIYFYRSHGYFMVEVDIESDPEKAVDGVVPSRFIVRSGGMYRFNGVTQRYRKPEERRLKPGFLEARFRSLQGKPYSPAELEERYRAVMSTGLYSNLQLKQVPNEETGEVELRFTVEEAKAREFGVAIGYGTYEGPILGAQYTDLNFLGYGRPLGFRSEISQYLLRGELSYTDPWIFDTNYTMRFRLYAMNHNLKDYMKLESGLHSALSRKLGDHLELSAFILTRGAAIGNTGGIDPLDLGPTDYVVNSVGTSLTLDFRNSVLNPSRGLVINATNDVALEALGSSVEFLRNTLRISYYQPIGNTLLAIGARGGMIHPLNGDHSLPIDERFFNGGSRSIRSFVERSFGPKDRYGHSIGGQTFTVFNIEHIFPIAGDLKGAVFFDAGTVGRTVGTDFGPVGMAVGLGLRYQLPIGPIRIDYGHNPIQREGEPMGAWHFSFGFAF